MATRATCTDLVRGVCDLDGFEGDLAEVKLRRVTFSVRRVGRSCGGNASYLHGFGRSCVRSEHI